MALAGLGDFSRLAARAIAALLLAAAGAGPGFAQAPAGSEFGRAADALGVDLYRTIAAAGAGDILISPASISAAFALAYAGARGPTAEEIAAVLHYPPYADFHFRMGEHARSLEIAADGRRVALANAAFIDERSVVDPNYTALLAAHYFVLDQRKDFRGDPEGARGKINDWVEDKTEDRIKDLLAPGDVTAKTRFVLVNAIHMKADWEAAFDPADTAKGRFRLAGGKTAEAQFMRQREDFRRLKRPAFEALEMPYHGGELSLVVFLPRGFGGLSAFERALTAEKLGAWLAALDGAAQVHTDLKFPRLRFEERYELSELLRSLGMKAPFDDGAADFSGMAVPALQIADEGRGVKIGKVIHKTFLEANEAGTEAAAATAIEAVVVTGSRMPPPPKAFFVDRPFFFVIRHNESGTPLFMGRVVDPR